MIWTRGGGGEHIGWPATQVRACGRGAPRKADTLRSPAVGNVAAHSGRRESLNVMPARNAEEYAAYAAARKRREHIGARYTEEEAQRIRNAAAGAGKSLGAYILATADGIARPIVDLADAAKLNEAISALYVAPEAVRALEADLGRLSGRLSHFFEMDYAFASKNRAELHETLRNVNALLLTIPRAIEALERKADGPNDEIARAVRGVVKRLEE
jgi:uncharacterized protein (DUF1778 family)